MYFTKHGIVSLDLVDQITRCNDIQQLELLNSSNNNAIRHIARTRKNIVVAGIKAKAGRKKDWLQLFLEERLHKDIIQ